MLRVGNFIWLKWVKKEKERFLFIGIVTMIILIFSFLHQFSGHESSDEGNAMCHYYYYSNKFERSWEKIFIAYPENLKAKLNIGCVMFIII